MNLIPVDDPNLQGRGWLVVNKTGEALNAIDGRGTILATILPGHQHPFTVTKGPSIFLRFTGENGEKVGKPLSYTFANG